MAYYLAHPNASDADNPVEREPESDDDQSDLTCEYCHGTGGEPFDDGVTPCPECDGEGYRWWE